MMLKTFVPAAASLLGGVGILQLSVTIESYALLVVGLAMMAVGTMGLVYAQSQRAPTPHIMEMENPH